MKNRVSYRFVTAVFAGLLASVGVFGQQPDVARRTTAVTYPPGDSVDLIFRGTTRFPRMKGSASVERTTRKNTLIKLHVENMPRPFELGPGYATYIVWAISPDGLFDNLGEIKRSGSFFIDSKIEVTTPLQTFSIIITAEPHYLVTRPSQQIMLENVAPSRARNGKLLQTLPAIQYFGNSGDYFRDPRTPEIAEVDYAKTPPTILQARQAVALARFAGAERDASTELAEAQTLLQNAVGAWQAGRDSDTVDISARRAIGTAVKAESLAAERKAAREQRNERLRADDDIRRAEDRYADAQSEITGLREELARETRNRELAERDVLNFSNQVRDLRDENGRIRDELARVKLDLENANAKLAAVEREKQAAEDQRDAEVKAAKAKENETSLINALKAYGTVAREDRGIVVTLPESFWAGPRSSILTPAGTNKLASLGGLLSANSDYRVAVESYTDDSGDASVLQTLTDRRSYAIAEKLASLGIEEGRLMAKGFGSGSPIASNKTSASRAKNRRVLLVLSLTPQN